MYICAVCRLHSPPLWLKCGRPYVTHPLCPGITHPLPAKPVIGSRLNSGDLCKAGQALALSTQSQNTDPSTLAPPWSLPASSVSLPIRLRRISNSNLLSCSASGPSSALLASCAAGFYSSDERSSVRSAKG
ncbi:hypothetical protein C8Q77DRAFT_457515 [Trametes polyzona]|nr:hypothetical protein C8Q77DRAFT_457515 [Trametes polyzona]